MESQLMGGIVLATWNHEADVGRMGLIDGVVLETDGLSHIIGKAMFPNIISQAKTRLMTTSRC